MDSSQ